MKFGVCCTREQENAVIEAGFDYVELAALSLHSSLPPSELPVHATNAFFPWQMKLMGPHGEPYLDYAKATIQLAASVGVEIMVIGSGSPRRAVDGMSVTEATNLFITIVTNLQRLADPYGIHIAPESLNRLETNVGNDLRALAIHLKRVNVGFTADSYHILKEADLDGHEPDWSSQIPFLPTHVHISDLDRKAPSSSDRHMQDFCSYLKSIGYDGSVSIEGQWEVDELPHLLAELRKLFHSKN